MSDTRIDFRYTPSVVASAQQMRFLRSSQFKIILFFWAGSMLFIIVPLLFPGAFPQATFTSWELALQVVLAYSIGLAVLILATPWIDFYVNRFWRLPLVLRFNDKQLRVSVSGKQGGLRLQWSQVKRVEENRQAMILFYGGANKFIILPKNMFTNPAAERRFRDLLARRASLPVITGGEDVDQEESPDEKSTQV